MVSVLRTLLVAGVLCGLVVAAFWRMSADQDQRALDRLETLNAEMESRLAQKSAMIARLNRSRRLAHIHILGQTTDADEQITQTRLLLIELDDDSTELARQTFTIPGDVLFVDAWTVKFDRNDVADDLAVFRLKPDADLFSFRAGQYTVIGVPASAPRVESSDYDDDEAPGKNKMIRRAYSIASSSKINEYVELYITLVRSGELTPRLWLL
ncbi:MAG: hypothetical protein IIB99_10380, partial [Planctomycetes bacterium]|nr:hypothetical protein [Planctomycetota bacterium]